ncbi:MAG: hypothetical protein AAFV29_11560, partial [Myxococcota bacterium]
MTSTRPRWWVGFTQQQLDELNVDSPAFSNIFIGPPCARSLPEPAWHRAFGGAGAVPRLTSTTLFKPEECEEEEEPPKV